MTGDENLCVNVNKASGVESSDLLTQVTIQILQDLLELK